MSEILDKIKSRGYWRITIRPTVFRVDQLSTLDKALGLVQRSAVTLDGRGWTFPKVNLDRDLLRGEHDEWVGQELDWHMHVEAWRMYRSAQFLYLGGFWSDWLDQSIWHRPPDSWQPMDRLSVGEVILKFEETFKCAAGLALAEPEFTSLIVHAELVGLRDRVLTLGMPGRRWELDRRTLISNRLEYKKAFTREEIIGRTDELALLQAAGVFNEYRWDPGLEMLKTLRGELLS